MATHPLDAQLSVTPASTNPLNWKPDIFKIGSQTIVNSWSLDSFWRSACGIQAIAHILNANFLEISSGKDGSPLHDNLAGDLHLAVIELANGISTQLMDMAGPEINETVKGSPHE